MKTLILALSLLLLAGCDIIEVDVIEASSGYDVNDVDTKDQGTGLRIKYHSEYKPELDYFVNEWKEVTQCTGLYAPTAPLIILIDDDVLGEGSEGAYYGGDQVIVMEVLATIWGDLTKHEMIHYLMDMNGYTGDDHANPWFAECAPESKAGVL